MPTRSPTGSEVRTLDTAPSLVIHPYAARSRPRPRATSLGLLLVRLTGEGFSSMNFAERLMWTLGACCAGAFVIWLSGAALWGYVLSAVIIGCVTPLLVPRMEARREQGRASDLAAARGLWHP